VIALVNPPSPFLIDQRVHPSLGPLYINSFLRSYGLESQVIDLAGSSDIEIEELGYTPELIGISANTPQFGYAKAIAASFREMYPDVPIAIGGPHATVDPESCSEFDYVVQGEGELAAVSYRDWKERHVRYPYIGDIDSIPYPDRSAVDLDSYHYHVGGERATTLVTSRGCPYNCTFCSHVWGDKVRFHSPEYVIGEVRYLKREYGYRGFMFFDDIFVLPRKRITRITELLKGEDIVYRCLVRSDCVDKRLLKMLKESGCIEIGFGAESGSQKVLGDANKRTSVARNTWLVKAARAIGLRTKAFMMLGLPGETPETCQETYDWIKNTCPDSWDISIYTPYRGSKIVNNPEIYDIEIKEQEFKDAWYKGIPGEYKCSVSTSALGADEIVWWRDKIELELGGTRTEHPASVILGQKKEIK